MKKKHLEIILDQLKPHPKPKASLEQYTIEGRLASEILFFAKDDIEGSAVVDLGCGTGILAIGAKLLNAKKVIGIDIDEESIGVAKENAKKVNVNVDFYCMDVADVDANFIKEICGDLKIVVIQNPPFGSQKRHADRIFLDKALEIGDVVYSIHNAGTKDFVVKYVNEKGGIITHIFQGSFKIPHIYEFHKKEVIYIPVNIFRIISNK
ncbi:METTL5 family protein [Methanotorris formicicus]|uniref:Ribosomal L11 methyltransferase n=1 Tax=Methanotorris formicicus Mc-S-70 TaxID=647171 RepID=H1KYH2_9EURY|nr:METTL5 family protein [Methanotorris formicicus]EHP87087.1 ribosomal L11 methyltransferase [Methanotorris formicicus Mc-S-70]